MQKNHSMMTEEEKANPEDKRRSVIRAHEEMIASKYPYSPFKASHSQPYQAPSFPIAYLSPEISESETKIFDGALIGSLNGYIITGIGLIGVSVLGLTVVSPPIVISALAVGMVTGVVIGASIAIAENIGSNNQGQSDLQDDEKKQTYNSANIGSSGNQQSEEPLLDSLTSLSTGIVSFVQIASEQVKNFFDEIPNLIGFLIKKDDDPSVSPSSPRSPSGLGPTQKT